MDDDCQPPQINIKLNKTLANAFSITTLESLRLGAEVSLRCKTSKIPLFSWEVSSVDNTNKQFLPFITLAKNVKNFTLRPRELEPGYHYVRFKAEMQGHPKTLAYDYGFLQIVLPRLVSVIDGPSSAVQGSGLLLLSAAKSYDPDLSGPSQHKGLTYSWFCRKENEDLSNITSLPVDLPLTNSRDRGGCFGYGPGRLNASSEQLQLNPELMKAKLHYVIELVVTKDKRISLATSHRVYIVTALQFSIK